VERPADDAGEEVGVGREPGVYRLLRQAVEFRRLLDEGEVESRAELARRAGVSRARVTQVMGVWRLHRPVVEHLRVMAARGGAVRRRRT
jgi:DNA-binding transcriptional MocR family regulator